jgi:DNA-binding response OmpR family regulator
MSPRVLVVDDETALRSLVARAFREEGHEVVEAADGLSALDVFRSASKPFDLVVTNSRMPHLDGTHLVECIRQLNPTLPIIHLSGSHASRRDHLQLPDDVLTIFKPFNLSDLIDEAEKLLQEPKP